MKEFEAVFSDGLGKGLRPDSRRERNTERLVECFNVVPKDGGLELYSSLSDLNDAGVSWGGMGTELPSLGTRTVTIDVTDYVSGADLETVAVWIDGVSKGNTDASGELTVEDVELGGHTLKLTKTGYTGSEDDTLLNDYFMVT